MTAFLRGVAIFSEWVVLTAIIFAILFGVRLILADFGIGPKYNKAIVMGIIAAGSLLAVFFIGHLTMFYPGT